MNIYVTGVAGFIGFHVAKECLKKGYSVTGIDNLNDYYDPSLKKDRLKILRGLKGDFEFYEEDLINKDFIISSIRERRITHVINLAAQAGVRKSLEDPISYIDSNIVGFVNILEACRHNEVQHLTYASTSSVYGLSTKIPFSEKDIADHPIQLYAASKRANELLAHSYSHLFGLPTTGLRFFTVYGPWGRPDMALFLFTKNILENKPIKVFNKGNHSRDFTYIDDIVKGILLCNENIAKTSLDWDSNSLNPSESSAPFKVYNIGSSEKVSLDSYIEAIESELGKKAERELLPLQPGDIPDSLADISLLTKETGYKPETNYKEGVSNFIKWYKSYYGYK